MSTLKVTVTTFVRASKKLLIVRNSVENGMNYGMEYVGGKRRGGRGNNNR